MQDTKKMLRKKIVNLKNIYKLNSSLFCHKVYIFSFIHEKRFYKNRKFNFPGKIYEILK